MRQRKPQPHRQKPIEEDKDYGYFRSIDALPLISQTRWNVCYIMLVSIIILSGVLPPLGILYAPRNLAKYNCWTTTVGLPHTWETEIKSSVDTSLHLWWVPSPFLEQTFSPPAGLRPTKSLDGTCTSDYSFKNLHQKYGNESNANVTVIVIHGHGGSKGKLIGQDIAVVTKAILPFHSAGFNVLALDLRSHGYSKSALPVTFGYHESDDVISALHWLLQNADGLEIDPNRIAVWGESMGAATVLLAAEKDKSKHFKAVIADSSYKTGFDAIDYRLIVEYKLPAFVRTWFWGWWDLLPIFDPRLVNLISSIKEIKIPILLLHGRHDSIVSFQDGLDLLNAAKEGRDEGKVGQVHNHWYDGGHTLGFRKEQVFGVLIDFIEAYV